MSQATEAVKQVTEGGPVEHYMDSFRQYRTALPGSGIPWIQRMRDAGIARFAHEGFPTTRWEDWKYTSVAPIEKRAFVPTRPGPHEVDQQTIAAHEFEGLEAYQLVFVDGQFAPDLSKLDGLPERVVIAPFGEALPRYVDDIEMHIGRYADMGTNPFIALNTAFMADGVFVHLPTGVQLDRPIHAIYASSTPEVMSSVRNLVIAEESSEATIIEHYVGLGDIQYFTNAVTEIYAAPNAGVEHYKLEQESKKAFHIATIQAHQERDSRFTSYNVALNGRLVRNDINTWMDDEGAQCTFNGLYLLSGRQHADNHTCVQHAKPSCTSRELYKGVLDGYARGVFNGKVVIHKYARQTDSDQASHVLLLSRNAEADPKPQLEIYNDDVKATHGSTVGQLDETAMYYLRSRGIPESEAQALLTFAFANDVISHMRLEPVRNYLEGVVTTRLPHGEEIKESV